MSKLQFPLWVKMFYFTATFRIIASPTVLSFGDVWAGVDVKWPETETDNSFPYSAEFRNAWSSTSTPPYVFMVSYRTSRPTV
jgi:hypothetical protein